MIRAGGGLAAAGPASGVAAGREAATGPAVPADTDLAERLSRAIARGLGAPGTVRALDPVTAGATKRTWRVDAEVGDVRLPLILQLTAPVAQVGAAALTPRLAAAAEAALMTAARAAGVPAPCVRLVLAPQDGLGEGYLTDRVPAESLGRRIVHDPAYARARAGFARDCGHALAAIHAIPTHATAALADRGATAQIDAYAQVVRHFGVRSPALAHAFAWVRAHAPAPVVPRLVHGDFRMGNLLTDADGLRCVLDWEGAHLGDPLEDLGYLCLRSWRFGGALPVAGVATRDALVGAYEDAAGCRVDREALRFWEAWGNLKWSVMALRRGLRHRDAGTPPELEPCATGRRMAEPLWDFLRIVMRAEDR